MKELRLMKVVLILVFLCAIDQSSAQGVNTQFKEFVEYQAGAKKVNKAKKSLEYNGISGSPYFTNNFQNSDLYFENGKVRTNIHTRLNLFDNSLQFEQGEEVYVVDQVEMISKIVFANTEVLFLGVEYYEKKGFYQLIEDGNSKLLKRLKVNFINAKESSGSYSEDTVAEFKREKEKLFIQLNSGDLLYFKNKKQFNLQFSTNIVLKSYVKKEKLNPMKIDDLQKIVIFMNANGI